MRLLSLLLEQFRSHTSLTFDLTGSSVHLFVGPNGSGKTNLLEAISVLSLTRSCLDRDEADLQQWEKEHYRVSANAETDQGEPRAFEIVSQSAPRKQKAYFVNGVRIPVSRAVGSLPTVIFLPQDLELFTGPPSERRRFLDHVLSQVSLEYAEDLASYQKLLKQRNALLRRIAEGTAKPLELSVWDAPLAETGAKITIMRLELAETFSLTLCAEMRSLGESGSEAVFRYERKGESREQSSLMRELASLLEHFRDRDILLQSSTIGPHRDDWMVDIDGRSLPTFASRGQQRTAVLALLFLEVSYLGLRRGERPVILLDDVFSELDDRHQEGVLASFEDHQVLITATHAPKKIHGARVWKMENALTMATPSP